MLKEFDLWLDESGKFANERETVNIGYKPSLIGGWLMPHDRYKESDFADMVVESGSAEGYHSAGLTREQKNKEVIPTLVRMHNEFGGRMFFVENKEVRQYGGNKELYLTMMAYGLLHLLQTLNAVCESVHLYVTIARRVDVKGDAMIEITDEEYEKRLNAVIRAEKAAGHIILDNDTQMEFHIDSARTNTKLKMADYACNAELTINSGMFTDASRLKFFEIRNDAIICSFVENYEENRIRQYLTTDNVADALFDATASHQKSLLENMLPDIISRLTNFGYRSAKVQLDQCVREFTTDAYMEDDFEDGERIMRNLIDVVIPAMYKEKLPCEKLHFAAELNLTDMYLREGNLSEAVKEIMKCEEAQKKLPASLENILAYYQLIEKQGLCEIDFFEFQKGYETMGKASKVFEEAIDALELSKVIHERYPSLISEYYGDALCMKIYAGMLAQRQNPKLYDELVHDSDIALLQYGPHEGELERHRQYRAFIEAQAGHIYEACVWLFMTQLPEVDNRWLNEKHDINKALCGKFINEINTGEIQASRLYYLMYYTRIMAEAFEHGNELANDMLSALSTSETEIEPDEMEDQIHVNARGKKIKTTVVDAINNVIDKDTGFEYHPSESIYWRTAYSLYMANKKVEAHEMYEQAIFVCFNNKEYLQLMVTGLAIQAERLALLYNENSKSSKEKAEVIRKKLVREIEIVNKALDKVSINFIAAYTKELSDEIKDVNNCDWRKLWKTSRKISF